MMFKISRLSVQPNVVSLLPGMGALCTMSGCLSAIGIYFKKQLYLANGIIGAGGGLGTIVLGILAEYFIDVYGWRGSLLIMSALALQICVSGALIFRLHDHAEDVQVDLDHSKITGEETLPKAEGRLLSRSEPSRHGIGSVSCTQTVRYFRDPRFLGITFATLLMNFSGFSLMLFLKDIMLQRLSSVNYKEFVIWLGSGSVVGRVGAGVISTRLNPFLFYLATSIICAIDIFMLSVAETQWTFHVLGFFFGGCHGIFCVLQAIKIAHIFGRKEMAVLWGYTMSLASIGVLIGPPLGGTYLNENLVEPSYYL